jgi:proteasome lid subunit RPN8/RPN11
MNGLIDINSFEFESRHIDEAYSFLKKAGKKSYEAVALFAGKLEGKMAIVTEVICPLQVSSRSQYGLMYTVDGKELHRINLWLYQKKLRLIAQIHSHPTEAYHSETDDEFPIMTTIGCLSIVVPYFAKEPLNHFDWAYYRLISETFWEELNHVEVIKLIKII